MRARAAFGVIVAAAVLASTPAGADPLAQELILEVRVGRRIILSEALLAYERNARIYLPLMEMAESLEFPIEIDPAEAYAEGWYLSENRRYSIDARRGELVREGKPSEVDLGAFIDSDLLQLGELYVAIDVLEKLWPVRMLVDMAALAVMVEPEEHLPIQSRLERERSREMQLARRPRLRDLSVLPNGYRRITPPVIDWESDLRLENDGSTGRHAMNAVHDMLGLGTSWYASVERIDTTLRFTDLRLTLRRSIAVDNLVRGVEDVQAGDVRLPGLRLVEGAMRGRGAVISSFPAYEADAFDRTTVEGNGVPGWEVEIYRNNELLDFQVVSPDGRYRFDEVQLVIGVNRLRVVQYGPQGQLRERIEQIIVGNEMAPPGEFRFRLGALEAGRDLLPVGDDPTDPTGLTLNVETAYGLNQRVSIFSRYNRVPTEQGERNYMMLGLAGTALGGYGQLEINRDAEGGTAYDLQFARSFALHSLSSGVTFYDGFESPLAGFGTSRTKLRARARLDSLVPTPLGPMSVMVQTNHRALTSGFGETQIELRQSMNGRPVRVTHAFDATFLDGGQDRSEGSLSLSTGTGRLRVRAGVDYDVTPAADVSQASTTGTYTFDERWVVSSTVRHDVADSITSTGAVVSRDFGVVLLGMDGGWTTEDDFNVGMRLGMSVGPIADGSYGLTSAARTTQGAFRARVFIDHDHDGQFGPADTVLPDVRLWVGAQRTRRGTDAMGQILVADMQALRSQPVRIDETSLEDPYWVPVHKGCALVSRPGAVPEIVLPVLETGAIDGVVRLADNGREVPGMELELVGSDGDVERTATSSYDGFYVFERVRPGRYTIRTSADDRFAIEPVDVDVDVDDPFVIDLGLRAHRPL